MRHVCSLPAGLEAASKWREQVAESQNKCNPGCEMDGYVEGWGTGF